jgi:hypothetical protein
MKLLCHMYSSARNNVVSDLLALDNCVLGIPPAEGDSWRQHRAMEQFGLCKEAAKHKNNNRYVQ